MSQQVTSKAYDAEYYKKVTDRVSMVGVAGNLMLSLFKMTAGIVAHSGAMISDAVHSASDVFGSFIVILGVRISSKASDDDHNYGHERLECIVAIVLSVILLITGLFIGYKAVLAILSPEGEITVPGVLALVAAAVSIVTKELMFHYTRINAKRIDSTALYASAWHHRSDALSSVGALIGIGAARMGHPVFEPIASLVICLFIAKAAWDIFKDAADKMVDKAADKDTVEAIEKTALSAPGVMSIDRLRTRVFGNRIYVDIEIGCDGTLSLNDAHAIAQNVHDRVETGFPVIKHIMVHVNPHKVEQGQARGNN